MSDHIEQFLAAVDRGESPDPETLKAVAGLLRRIQPKRRGRHALTKMKHTEAVKNPAWINSFKVAVAFLQRRAKGHTAEDAAAIIAERYGLCERSVFRHYQRHEKNLVNTDEIEREISRLVEAYKAGMALLNEMKEGCCCMVVEGGEEPAALDSEVLAKLKQVVENELREAIMALLNELKEGCRVVVEGEELAVLDSKPLARVQQVVEIQLREAFMTFLNELKERCCVVEGDEPAALDSEGREVER